MHRHINRVLAALAGVILGLFGGFTYTVLRVEHANHRNSEIARHNCQNIGTLANIERAFITRQEQQIQALLKSGVTFGIPKRQIPGLLKASRESQALFLVEHDALAAVTCKGIEGSGVPVVAPKGVRPGEKPHGLPRRPGSPWSPLAR